MTRDRGNACQAIVALIHSIRHNESSLAAAVRVSPYGLDTELKECGSNVLLFRFALVWRAYVWRDNFVEGLARLAKDRIVGDGSVRMDQFVEWSASAATEKTDEQLKRIHPRFSWNELDTYKQDNILNLWKFQRAREARQHQAAKTAVMAMEHILGRHRLQRALLEQGSLPRPLTPRTIIQKIRESER